MAEKKTLEQQEQERAELLAHEDDLLRGLLAAAEDEEETVEIEIARKGEVVLRFRIRPLRDHEYEECREKATTYHKNQFGVRVPKDTDPTKFRALLIYKATVDEDRERLWKNKAAWERLGVLSGPDLIARVLRAGEMAAIVEKIDEISGYGAEVERQREELAKN
ncbi:MAG: hypothetical protein LOD90_00540 [Symbiobacteriaceae bacterium]